MARVNRRAAAVAAALALLAGCSAAEPEAGPAERTDPARRPAETATPPTPAGSTPAAPTAAARARAAAPADTCARAVLARLSTRQRVRQLLVTGIDAEHPGRTPAELREGVGGVLLTGRSKAGTARTRYLVGRLVRSTGGPAGVDPLVAADQEGGEIRTLSGPGFTPIPSAVRQGRRPAAELAAGTRRWAGELAAAGVTLDLAPVADTVPAGQEAANDPIGALGRQYGSDPAQVAADVVTVTGALQDRGVAATLKHFPGLGRVRANTDFSARAVDPVADARDPHLEPFRAGIRAGAAAVMISSARYPRLDGDTPAVFSRRIVTGLLRDRLGWQGLVVSDDLSRAEAVARVPVGQRAVRFVASGGDLVVAVRGSDARPMTGALLARAAADPAFRARVDAAALNLLRVKQRFGALDCRGV